MATYINIYDMQNNANYGKQVTTACRIAAYNITNEAANFTNHAARLAWAQAILSYNGLAHGDIITRMLSAASSNATLQAAAPTGPWLDSDIQFVVNSFVDIQSTNVT